MRPICRFTEAPLGAGDTGCQAFERNLDAHSGEGGQGFRSIPDSNPTEAGQ
jgi:hypothetical protein